MSALQPTNALYAVMKGLDLSMQKTPKQQGCTSNTSVDEWRCIYWLLETGNFIMGFWCPPEVYVEPPIPIPTPQA